MELPFKELTHKVIGCAMEVHRVLGPGLELRFSGLSMIKRKYGIAI